jgi:hypothetical protein
MKESVDDYRWQTRQNATGRDRPGWIRQKAYANGGVPIAVEIAARLPVIQ